VPRNRTGKTGAAGRRLLLLFGVVFIVVATLFALARAGLALNTGIRAYVNGESLWSKSQKDAVFSLQEYLRSGDETAWKAFVRHLAIPLGDRRARLAMEQSPPDPAAARSGFLAGGNHPDDIGMMIFIYRRLRWEPHFARTIDIWERADRYILQLRDTGEQARALVSSGSADAQARARLQEQILRINAEVRPLEESFSRVMGDAARSLNRVVLITFGTASVLMLLIGGLLLRRIAGRVFEAEAHYRATFEEAGVGIAHIDLEGRCIAANAGLAGMLGRSAGDLEGEAFERFEADDDAPSLLDEAQSLLGGADEPLALDKKLQDAAGQALWARINITLLRDLRGHPAYFIAVIEDITERRRLAEQLSFQASHDAVTGLINRYEFESRLHASVEHTDEHGANGALIYLDLDQFKIVNDQCGHMAGDALLAQLGPLIRSCVRSRDSVARLGGDEFAVLLESCPANAAIEVAEKIRTALNQFRFRWQEQTFSLTASFGVVPFGEWACDEHARQLGSARLLSAADQACYVAKNSGRNHVHVARIDDPAFARQRDEVHRLEQIRSALLNDRFFLDYQPMIAAADQRSRPIGYEALARLRDESGKTLSPTDFMPIAERFGIIVEVDCWVLQHVLESLSLPAPGFDEVEMVAINVSGLSLSNPRFIDDAIRLASEHRAQANRLCIEITETAAISNLENVRDLIDKLQALGCRFALDDFGSGFSSFAYLSALPVEFVKIDGLFVRELDREPIHEAMVRSINEVTHSMGKLTIAECVESDATRRRLCEIGVDYLQGDSIGHPGPLPVGNLSEAAGRSH